MALPLECGTGSAPSFARVWACGKSIRVKLAPSAEPYTAEIDLAIAEWNRVLRDPRTPRLPDFVRYTGTSPDVTVEVVGGGSDFCGEHHAATAQVILKSWAGGTCNLNANHSGAGATMVHELLGVYGFTDGLEKSGVAGISDGCVNHLPADKTVINSTLCQHEIEHILKAYGFRTAGIDSTIWRKRIVTGVNVDPDSLTFTAPGETGQLVARSVSFDNSGAGGGGGSLNVVGIEGSGVTVNWTSDSSSIVTVGVTTGLATAVDSGATIIRARIAGGTGDSLAVGGLMLQLGSAVPVAVTAAAPPPPPANYGVTDISGPGPPITIVGTQTFRAHFGDAPLGYSVQVKWRLDFSDGAPSITAGYGSTTRSFYIHEGSYNLEITAYPAGGASPRIEDFPVCNIVGGGGGGDLLQARVPDGGSTPNAKQGC